MTDLRDPQDRGLISLVIPVFNEEDGIDQLRERLGPCPCHVEGHGGR